MAIEEKSKRGGLLTIAGELLLKFNCAKARNVTLGSLNLRQEANLLYEVARTELERAQYEPRGLDRVRGRVLDKIDQLRQFGFPGFAADLNDQLTRSRQLVQAPGATKTRLVQRSGTGFLVRPDGVLLTAFHVVDRSRAIAVRCPGSQRTQATLACFIHECARA